ncbi:MAG: DUF5131 family protein [Bacteroidales bacterium]|nr:DUF5131 family protein [Bacteroidales bacterium]
MEKSNGNMYEWITHTANPLSGECLHKCSYCYVNKLKHAKPVIAEKYTGKPKISENGLKQISGKDKFIFISDMTDLFAKDVPITDIVAILTKCSQKPQNKYLFQTKNPERFFDVWQLKNGDVIFILDFIPQNSVIATTIESNIHYKKYMGNTPHPNYRAEFLGLIDNFEKYVTIEPIIDFDLSEFVRILKIANPKQVNIGADSGKNNLPEPSKEKILQLISELEIFTVVKQKSNLKRLLV